jgi:hypothetical protein
MFRFEGDVFLLGTAISALSYSVGSKKLATILAQLIGKTRGGGRIVANEGAL